MPNKKQEDSSVTGTIGAAVGTVIVIAVAATIIILLAKLVQFVWGL